ncbi:MAG: hypothetical protein J5I83_13095 [Nitrosomonas communis]|nr:hypothetical protein [Nitrosomonas communis]MCO6428972.1 hypothetical protein [Nitrosomonas communis]
MLTDQIIANRLVVVYAKSGLGKTSLLNAGVAQPLREDGFLPLVARVNIIKQDLIRTVLDGIRVSAESQGVEYHHGNELSLWHFFKTAEFWRGDLLLTPVLILDQFEELFTLHGDEVRAGLLTELGHLIRGIRPAAEQATSSSLKNSDQSVPLTDAPPEIRVVISLREDYLGYLEEATNYIPQILNNRFRLTPLSAEAAAAAIEGPTKVQDQRLATKPFAFQPKAVQGILDYLLRRTKTKSRSSVGFIEPFHLQLICQRVEALVAQRQHQAGESVEIDLADLGGEKGLKTTLRSFYMDAVRSIQPIRNRKRVRRLCEQYLISPEGRRLSLEEVEIKRILKLDRSTLQQLVNGRLLRTDQRADSWYYELSHDSLIEPILTTRRIRGVVFGLLGLLGSVFVGFGALSSILGGLFVILSILYMDTGLSEALAQQGIGMSLEELKSAKAYGLVGMLIFVALGGLLCWAAFKGIRGSVETLNRYVPPPT